MMATVTTARSFRSSTMKAITLWQPWATLMSLGAKRFETRSWSTAYRGPLIIHAARRKLGAEEIALCQQWPVNRILQGGRLQIQDLPFGCCVAVGQLVRVYRTETIRMELSEQELALGDYGDGRFAWQIENLTPLSRPIPARGKQGLWTPDPGLVAQVLAATVKSSRPNR